MQVHWGSRDLLGLAGVERGLRFVFIFCLFGGSNLRLYDEEALRENLKDGDCKNQKKKHFALIKLSKLLSVNQKKRNLKTYATFFKLFGIDWRSEIESPGIARHRIFPVNKTFRRLTDSCTWKYVVIVDKVSNEICFIRQVLSKTPRWWRKIKRRTE